MSYKENLEHGRNQANYQAQSANNKQQYLDADLRYWASGRLAKAARRHNIKFIRQLIKVKTVTVQKWKGIGPKTMEELLEFKEQMTLLK